MSTQAGHLQRHLRVMRVIRRIGTLEHSYPTMSPFDRGAIADYLMTISVQFDLAGHIALLQKYGVPIPY